MKHTKTNNPNWNNWNRLQYTTCWVRALIAKNIPLREKGVVFTHTKQNGIAINSPKMATKPPIAI